MGKQTQFRKQHGRRQGTPKREQPRKDSRSKRVNFDNERESKFKDAEMRDGTNDVRWYSQNPQLLQSAASLSFYTTNGTKPPIDAAAVQAVPGVMALYWAPFVGGSDNRPLIQACNQIYSFTVHANSRNYSYDPADEMLLILAGAQLFSAISLGLRAYGVMRNYNGLDYYTPKMLLTAMNFNYEDCRNSLAQMWFDLNDLIAASRQIWIPNTMPLIERWFWMNANIYEDAETAKSQYYMFVPQQFLKYDETTDPRGGSLQPVSWASLAPQKWSQYVTMVRGLLNAMLDAEDRGMIFGDILKAYGADRIYSLSEISSDYKVQPVYNREVLTQIENASLTGIYPGAVTQNGNNELGQYWPRYSTTQISSNNYLRPSREVLNFHQLTMPTPEEVMVATRLKVLGTVARKVTTADGVTSFEAQPYTAGTEIIVAAYIRSWNWNADGTHGTALTKLQGTTNVSPSWLLMYSWVAFDWAPWITLVGQSLPSVINEGDSVDGQLSYPIGEYDNYTYLTKDELIKMHTAAVYSEFGVPQI